MLATDLIQLWVPDRNYIPLEANEYVTVLQKVHRALTLNEWRQLII